MRVLRYRWKMLMTWTLNTRISGLPCLQNPALSICLGYDWAGLKGFRPQKFGIDIRVKFHI